MKAAICREFNQDLSIENVTLGAPGGLDVHIRVAACSICHSDISFMKGNWGGDLPFLLGHEIAGTVESVGEEVTAFKAGDRVVATLMRSCGSCPSCSDALEAVCEDVPSLAGGGITDSTGKGVTSLMNTGGFAEEVMVHERQCIAIPDEMGFDIASLLGCGVITGFGAALRVAKITAGEKVGVIGAGGVGINAIQAARIAEASTIIAIDTATEKEQLFRDMGATDFIDPLNGDAVENVRRRTDGRGLDAVLVGVGSARAVESAVDMVRPGGRVIVMGMPATGDLASLDLSALAAEAKTITGTKMGSAMIREDIPKLIKWHQEGRINLKKLISHHYPFEDINTAIQTAMQPGAARVVVEFKA